MHNRNIVSIPGESSFRELMDSSLNDELGYQFKNQANTEFRAFRACYFEQIITKIINELCLVIRVLTV